LAAAPLTLTGDRGIGALRADPATAIDNARWRRAGGAAVTATDDRLVRAVGLGAFGVRLQATERAWLAAALLEGERQSCVIW
jgi:hypothetical protein